MDINENPKVTLSQARKILEYMRKGHRVTSLFIMEHFHIMSPRKRICDIEKIIGYPPLRETKRGTNKDGVMVNYKEYWLKPEDCGTGRKGKFVEL